MSRDTKRLSKLVRLRRIAEDEAAVENAKAVSKADKSRRKRRQLEEASRKAGENQSAASVHELELRDTILTAAARAVTAARSSELAYWAEAEAARAVLLEQTKRRKALERLQEKVQRAAAEERLTREVHRIQEASLNKASRQERGTE